MPLSVHRFVSSSTKFLPHSQYITFRAGDVIIKVDEPSDYLFYILHGEVTIYAPNKDAKGGAITLATLYSGDFFGELGLLTGMEQRSALVKASAETAIAKVDYDTFKKITEDDHEILLALSSQLANKLCATSRKLSEFIALERHVRKACADIEEERAQLLLDPLTELSNRQAYMWRMEEEFSRWTRYKRPVSMAICDIDYFKRVNDNYGHLAGDCVLQVIAKVLKNRLRTCDYIARYGGEEFVVLLPETPGADALLAMDSARALIEKCPLSYDGHSLSVTVSCGVTEFRGGDSGHEDVFKRADSALYQAKNSGRNSTVYI